MTDSIRGLQGSELSCDRVVINIENLRTALNLPSRKVYFIHKVPVKLRRINEAAYTPQLISIGPLHRDDKMLQPMQDHKIDFLNALLQIPGINLGDLVRFLRELEEQVRNSYFNQEFVRNINSDDFVQMMLLDGCFIVELFLRHHDKKEWEPYCSIIRSDLSLFENQLPYFLLDKLFEFINDDKQICEHSFFDLSASYFRYFLKEEVSRLQNSCNQVKHFLDLILNYQRPSELMRSVNGDNTDRKPKYELYLPSANELHEYGVEFKKSESKFYLDIKSNKNGVLEIPVLDVTYETERIYRNMIAMEQCQVNTDSYITHYIMLLDFLISTPKDVALLRRKRIINNYLGSDEAVAEMINKLGTGVIADITKSPYFEHLNNMDAFYKKRRNKWMGNLKRIYLQNPWKILSLIAAIVLLVCTLTETVCSILSVVK